MKGKLLIILLFFIQFVSAQVSAPELEVYAGGSAGIGEQRPFWNLNNQYGKFTLDKFEGIAGASIISKDTSETIFHFDYGLEGYGRINSNSGFVLHQAYASIRTPLIAVRAGMKEETIGNQDSTLSLGSTVWSHNTRPMPKLVIETPGYVDVPYTKGYVEINGSLAHGWFDQDRYVKNLFLHQKYLYLRIGGDYFLNASAGLIHFAQWGGVSPDSDIGSLPNNLEAFRRVFFARNGDSLLVGSGEAKNKLGNHLGSRNYKLNYNNAYFSIELYYQTLFEDASGLTKEFNKDGLSGISFRLKEKNHLINRVSIEFLKTSYQSGPRYYSIDSVNLRGNDNYFNHGIYKDGWTYRLFTLGTPMITSPILLDNNQDVVFENNRVLCLNLALSGKIKKLDYKIMNTFSINKGTYVAEYIPVKLQYSSYLEVLYNTGINGIKMVVNLAVDIGQMYDNNLGVILMLRKTLF